MQTAGKNSAFRFDGIDDFISGTLINPIGTNDFSVTGWIKTEEQAVSGFVWANNGGGGSTASEVFMNGGGAIVSRLDGVTSTSTTTGLDDGEWHHIGVTADRDGDLLIYIDGVLDDTNDISSSTNDISR